MANPLVFQGVLNKLVASALIIDFPQLNVTSSYLADDGISLAFEGEASAYLPTMTGAVPSPNPFQVATATIHLLKSQSLSDLWKTQMEANTTIGDVSITPDVQTGSGLSQYYLSNCTIKGVGELPFSGKSPDWTVTVQGTYYLNSSLFTGS